MNKSKLFAIANLLQIICLIGLFIYFFDKKEVFISSVILLVIAISGLIITIPELSERLKRK